MMMRYFILRLRTARFLYKQVELGLHQFFHSILSLDLLAVDRYNTM